MYDNFTVRDHWTGEPVQCIYQALITAISTRHADAVDIKFQCGGNAVWVSLPHPAWVEYNQRTGRVITDPMAVQTAGHFLKNAIERGENGGREMYTLTTAETLHHLQAVLAEHGNSLPL